MKRHFTDLPPIEIRVAMLRAEVTVTGLAREIGVSHVAVHLVIEGKSVSDRIRRHIANRIGIDVKRIWPSTYLYKAKYQHS
jgi:lambda repressor-like predicted transcriptional regulator